jgi:hypothetical protein
MGGQRRARGPTRPPQTIAALVGRDKRIEITNQLTRVAVVRFLEDPGELLELVTTKRPSAVILDLRPPTTGALASLLVDLAAEAPQMPVVFYDRADGRTVESLRTVLTPGLRMEYVVRPLEPLAPVVRQMLLAPLPPVVGPVLIQHIVPLAPPPLRVFLTIAALKATSGRGVGQIARWSGSSPRTVERRFHRAGWAGPQVAVQAFRALDFAWLMSEHGWSARRVQQARGLSHASAITRAMHRYCGGITPATLRESGGFDAAFGGVLAILMPHYPPLHSLYAPG